MKVGFEPCDSMVSMFYFSSISRLTINGSTRMMTVRLCGKTHFDQKNITDLGLLQVSTTPKDLSMDVLSFVTVVDNIEVLFVAICKSACAKDTVIPE